MAAVGNPKPQQITCEGVDFKVVTPDCNAFFTYGFVRKYLSSIPVPRLAGCSFTKDANKRWILSDTSLRITFHDGTYYVGHLDTKRRATGQSTLTYPNKTIYTGPFRDGLPHGKGTLTFRDGTTLTSTFDKGVTQARHTFKGHGYKAFQTFEGKIINGEPVEGTLTIQGSIHECIMSEDSNGERSLAGCSWGGEDVIFTGKFVIDPELRDGSMVFHLEGQAQIQFATTGCSLKGIFNSRNSHVEGTLTYTAEAFHEKFTGLLSWKCGEFNIFDWTLIKGSLTLRYEMYSLPAGSIYTGPFDGDNPHGEGVVTRSDGVKFKVTYDHGTLLNHEQLPAEAPAVQAPRPAPAPAAQNAETIAQLQNDKRELNTEVAKLREDVEGLRKDGDELKKLKEQLATRAVELQAKQDEQLQLIANGNALQARIDTLEGEKIALQNTIQTLKVQPQSTDIADQIKALEANIEQKNQTLKSVQTEKVTLEANLEAQGNEISALKGQNIQLNKQLEEIHTKHSQLEQQAQTLQQQLEAAQAQVNARAGVQGANTAQLAESREALNQARADVTRIERELGVVKGERDTHAKAIENLKRKLAQEEQEKAALSKQVEELKVLVSENAEKALKVLQQAKETDLKKTEEIDLLQTVLRNVPVEKEKHTLEALRQEQNSASFKEIQTEHAEIKKRAEELQTKLTQAQAQVAKAAITMKAQLEALRQSEDSMRVLRTELEQVQAERDAHTKTIADLKQKLAQEELEKAKIAKQLKELEVQVPQEAAKAQKELQQAKESDRQKAEEIEHLRTAMTSQRELQKSHEQLSREHLQVTQRAAELQTLLTEAQTQVATSATSLQERLAAFQRADMDITLVRTELFSAQKTRDAHATTIADLKQKLAAETQEKVALATEVEQLKALLRSSSTALQADLDAARAADQQKAGQIAELRASILSLHTDMADLEGIADAQTRELQTRNDDLTRQLQQIQAFQGQTAQKLAALQAELEAVQAKSATERLKDLQEAEQTIASLRAEIEQLKDGQVKMEKELGNAKATLSKVALPASPQQSSSPIMRAVEEWIHLPNGIKYSGATQAGIPQGEGTMIFPEGHEIQSFKGAFTEGKFVKGMILYRNKSSYNGEVLNDLPHGEGKRRLIGAAPESGRFEQGKFVGKQ